MPGAAKIGFSCSYIPTDNLSIMSGPIFGFDSSLRKTDFDTYGFMIFGTLQSRF